MADDLPPHSTRDEDEDYPPHRLQGRASFNDRWEDAYGPMSPREFRRSGGYPGPLTASWQRTSSPGYVRATGDAWLDRDDPSRRSYYDGPSQGRGVSFRGRGPRGYRRSDERIREDACECLTDDAHLDASDIEVTVRDCEITLSGTVDSRWEKRRAEDLVEMLSAVEDVHNELRVKRSDASMHTPRLDGDRLASDGTADPADPRH